MHCESDYALRQMDARLFLIRHLWLKQHPDDRTMCDQFNTKLMLKNLNELRKLVRTFDAARLEFLNQDIRFNTALSRITTTLRYPKDTVRDETIAMVLGKLQTYTLLWHNLQLNGLSSDAQLLVSQWRFIELMLPDISVGIFKKIYYRLTGQYYSQS